MNKKVLFGSIAMILSVGAPSAAAAAELYGIGPFFNTSMLYRIDPLNGAATPIGSTGSSFMAGIAFSPDGTLYGFQAGVGTGTLFEINTQTGWATSIGVFFRAADEGGLSFDPISGDLYAADGNDDDFLTVDPATGEAALVGDFSLPNRDISGIAFDATGTLFGYAKGVDANDVLVSIDPTTAEITEIGPLGFDSGVTGGLAFTPPALGGQLFLSSGTALYTVDPSTGMSTELGAHGVAEISGLAFIPEPSVASIMILSLSIITGRRSRQPT